MNFWQTVMAVASRGGGTAPTPVVPFVPTDLGAVLVAWWNADDHGTANMTDDGAGLISQWKDRVGGLALTGATTARPTWTSTAFNSAKAGCTFDATATNLAGTTLTNIPAAAVPSVIWTVGQVTTAISGISQAMFAYGVTGNHRRLTVDLTTGFISARDNVGASVQTVAITNGAPFLVAGQFDAASITSYWNGTAAASGANTLNTTNTRIRIGASASTSANQFFGGAIRHCIVTTALTTLQRQQLEGWLAWDSGIVLRLPSDHPYKNAPP